jgi:hypothetical protein
MTYTADHPPLPETPDQLRARIPGWGADLDPADRPSYPRERFDPAASGAHGDFPERQEEPYSREKSIEHGILPPVYGTVAPLHGVSGVIRRLAYAKYSEARLAHWLLLVLGDRVDAFGAHVKSFASLRPDDLVTETGLTTEIAQHGPTQRLESNRADTSHTWLDPILVAGPWVVTGLIGLRLLRGLRRR